MGDSYIGFRFEHSRASRDAPGGILREQYISVQKSYEDALEAVVAQGIRDGNIRLIEEGPSVLSEASARGIAHGKTARCDCKQ
jgi:hypothetical protein